MTDSNHALDSNTPETLHYGGTPMLWTPCSVRCISGGESLRQDEPGGLTPWDLRDMLSSGYGLIVRLEPGDATRYSVVITPLRDGFVLGTTGGVAVGSVQINWHTPTPPEHFRVLSSNEWTQQFLHWWSEVLRIG